mgnify:CR=1 FL=1
MKKSILWLAVLAIAACEKPIINDMMDDEVTNHGGNVTLNFSATGAQTRATVTIGDYFTKLNVMLFNEDGTKYFDKVRTQYSSDENFGQMSLTLPAGEYSVVAVGHSSVKSATIKSTEMVQFTASDGEKLTIDFIIKQMVGREMTNQFPPREGKPSTEVVLKVENVCSTLPKSFQNVSFELHRQEILGIGGLVGAQRTEFVEALFGLRSIASGNILLNNASYTSKNPGFAKSKGLALLTEERRATGIFGILPILENTVIANQRNYAHLGILNQRKM